MNITNELLAAYAEGSVTPEERKEVRSYLMTHSDELESVMMMMDEDYELDVVSDNKTALKNLVSNNNPQTPFSSDSCGKGELSSTHYFAASKKSSNQYESKLSLVEKRRSFDSVLSDLVNDLF